MVFSQERIGLHVTNFSLAKIYFYQIKDFRRWRTQTRCSFSHRESISIRRISKNLLMLLAPPHDQDFVERANCEENFNFFVVGHRIEKRKRCYPPSGFLTQIGL